MIFAQDFQWVSNYRKRHVKNTHQKWPRDTIETTQNIL